MLLITLNYEKSFCKRVCLFPRYVLCSSICLPRPLFTEASATRSILAPPIDTTSAAQYLKCSGFSTALEWMCHSMERTASLVIHEQ